MSHENQQITNYYDTLYSKLTGYLEKLNTQHDDEDIHGLRVTIKKIRAILSLVEHVQSGVPARHYRGQLKPLFKAAGRLREGQLNHRLIEQYCSGVKACRQRILDRAESARQELLALHEGFDMDALDAEHRQIRDVLATIDEDRIIMEAGNFIGNRLEDINLLIGEVDNDERLHEIRINLRLVNETLKLLRYIGADDGISLDLKITKSVADAIGDWHDYGVAMEALYEHSTDDERGTKQECVHSLKKAEDQQRQQAVDQLGYLLENRAAAEF